MGENTRCFQVDLGGLVDLLSRNLYSGPSVFVRELLQNGVDAITARGELPAQNFTPRIRFLTDGVKLSVVDNGIGLTYEEMQTLLATIGASSKRDELGFSRTDFLGQFGIGLLSCFMVSSTITVYSRSARRPEAPVARWVGKADGTWSVDLPASSEIPPELESAGTVVKLEALPGERIFHYAQLSHLIKHYGQYLTVPVSLEQDPAPAQILTTHRPPWQMGKSEQNRWCADNFGFLPFDAIKLDIPVAGATGVAFVLAASASPSQSLRNQVYLRSMLLGKQVSDVLPEWAYFVRVVLNAQHLNPTASREQLFNDEVLDATREQIGKQIRSWLTRLSEREPERFKEFTAIHMNGLKALALTDRPTRDLVAAAVPFQTSLGALPFDEIVALHGEFRYCSTSREYRSLEQVFAGNGLCVANAGFAFDTELLGQLALDRPRIPIHEVNPAEVLGVMEKVGLSQEAFLLPLLDLARQALAGQELKVEIRSFNPVSLPVLFLSDGDLAGRLIENTERAEEGLMSELLESLSEARSQGNYAKRVARFVLNAHCPVINELAGIASQNEAIISAIRGLYVQALFAGQHPMNQQARSWSASIFTSLITALVREHKTQNREN